MAAVAFSAKWHLNRGGSDQTRILIVDDHPLIRRGLRDVIGDEADLAICGEANDACKALALLTETSPDLIVTDISLASDCGIELVRRIKKRSPETRVLVCSVHDDTATAVQCLKAGANGFVSKQDAPKTLVEAIRQVLQGVYYFSPDVGEQLVQEASPSGRQPKFAKPSDVLSQREQEVFAQIGHGRSTREIARQLSISIKTVESHRHNIKRKLNLRDAVQLTHAAIQCVLNRGSA